MQAVESRIPYRTPISQGDMASFRGLHSVGKGGVASFRGLHAVGKAGSSVSTVASIKIPAHAPNRGGWDWMLGYGS